MVTSSISGRNIKQIRSEREARCWVAKESIWRNCHLNEERLLITSRHTSVAALQSWSLTDATIMLLCCTWKINVNTHSLPFLSRHCLCCDCGLLLCFTLMRWLLYFLQFTHSFIQNSWMPTNCLALCTVYYHVREWSLHIPTYASRGHTIGDVRSIWS